MIDIKLIHSHRCVNHVTNRKNCVTLFSFIAFIFINEYLSAISGITKD